MNKTPTQIAASLAKKIVMDVCCYDDEDAGILIDESTVLIKAAIEKATVELRREVDSLEGALHHPDDPRHSCIFKDKLRAAQGSFVGSDCAYCGGKNGKHRDVCQRPRAAQGSDENYNDETGHCAKPL